MAYIFVADSMGLPSFNFFVVGSERRIFFCSRVHIGHSRSSKVIDFGTNRKGVCDFLLVVNSNFVLSCTVSEIRRLISSKLRIFPTPFSFNALARGEPFRISVWMFYPEEQGLWAIRQRRFVILACVVFTQCQRVTDGRTDGQTSRS